MLTICVICGTGAPAMGEHNLGPLVGAGVGEAGTGLGVTVASGRGTAVPVGSAVEVIKTTGVSCAVHPASRIKMSQAAKIFFIMMPMILTELAREGPLSLYN